ncbi:MAG: hypothetical protein ACOZBH_04105 [Patescibacteria group bacterium]
MDKQKALRIEEIFLPPQAVGSDYFCENFIIFPEGKENYGGHILGIIEINATPTQQGQKISQTIISTLKDHYYRQVITSPDPKKLNLEAVFEHALQKTNEQVIQLIQNGQIQLILENFNFLVAVVKQEEADTGVIISQRGSMQCYLVHKTKKANYKIIDILTNAPAEQFNKVKIFNSIISGKIFRPDTLIISNETFARFFSTEKMNQLVTSRPIREFVEDFNVLLQKRLKNHGRSYSAIFIKQEDINLFEQDHASQKSISSLVSTQENTEKYLTPAIGINIMQKIKNCGHRLKSFLAFKKKPKGVIIDEIRAGTSGHLLKKILKKMNIFSVSAPAATGVDKTDAAATQKPKISLKILLPVIGALVIAFALSIVWLYQSRQEKKQDQAYTQSITQIEDKLNQAEAAFLFRNTEKSLSLLTEADELIKKLPQDSDAQKQKNESIKSQYESLQNKLLKLEDTAATALASLPGISQANAACLVNDQILALGAGNKVLIIDVKSGQVKETIDTESDSTVSAINTFDQSDLLILFQNGDSYLYSTENTSLKKMDIEFGHPADDFKIYNTNLYILSSDENQIYKLRGMGGTSLGAATEWIGDQTNLSGANSIAIDGDIYVLTANGNIIKFLSGKKQTFSVQKIEPAIQSADYIYTDKDSSFLYLIDRPTRRVIVLSKQGLNVVQYQVDNINEIDSLVIDEKNKKIYIIGDAKVWTVGMKHL